MNSDDTTGRLLPFSIENCDEVCASFWRKYGTKFLHLLKDSNYNSTSQPAKSWVEEVTVPKYALSKVMYPKRNDTHYKRTTVFSACVPGLKDNALFPELNIFPEPNALFHKGCSNDEVLLEVYYINIIVYHFRKNHGNCYRTKIILIIFS